jgi:hypothetical protein
VEHKDLTSRSDSPDPAEQGREAIGKLLAQWRAKAAEARRWASECADWDGANRHALRNRAGVYENCAAELLALVDASSQQKEKEKEDK